MRYYGVEGKLLSLLKNYLKNREQRVVLNGQTSVWKSIRSGISKGLVLGSFLFLIYINNLPDVIVSMCKIFADDTSLFSKFLNIDLEKINPDPSKQANEVIFLENWKIVCIFLLQSTTIRNLSDLSRNIWV